MNKTELLNKVAQTADERQLLARVWDKAEQAQRGVPAWTPFLSQSQQEAANRLIAAAGYPRHLWTGGFDDAERKLCAFFPDWQEEETWEPPFTALRCRWQSDDKLTHRDFLETYRKVLRPGGQIHFKTDNHDLFEWSLFQFPKAGFALSEVTRNLHEHGVQGVMTDYEEKFHALGTPINRCVGTMGPLPNVLLTEGLGRLLPGWEVRPVAESDVEAVAALLQTDPDYFAIEGPQPSPASVREDMAILPPRCGMEQKHYLALWKEGAPAAVLDLVEGYPRERTLFVGLFFLSPALRGQGTGRQIMEAVLGAAKGAGQDSVRLACLMDNKAGHGFWRVLGFGDLREDVHQMGENSAPVWIMERLI